MNNLLKKRIQKALEAPEPNQQEKARFLKTLPKPKIHMLQFIFIQATYLRKWTLFLSIILLIPALIGAYSIDQNTLWIISAFIPFLGLLAVTESTRSIQYGMSELEMSTPFSLKNVMLARMSVLGLLDAWILCCFVPLCGISSKISFLQTGVYLFVPYLLTVNISLWITRHFRNKEVIFACISVAVLVSGANVELYTMADFVYQFSYIKWWLILFAFLVGTMIYETYCTIKQTEEFAWNL